MFLITLTYLQPIEIVDKFLAEHRTFLDKGYQKNYFVVSGPCNPRTGGIIISNLKDRAQLMEIIQQDPFYINHIAEFNVIEFEPVKYHHHFSPFIEG
jgi:uncharacterized protein YciI